MPDVSNLDIQNLVKAITNGFEKISSNSSGDGGNTSLTWESSTTYRIGQICYPLLFGNYLRMECVAAGTSGLNEPSWTDIGTLVTDGTVTWVVDDIRDGAIPGDICPPSMIVRPGRIKANGALLSRTAYPRLLKFANDNGLIRDETDWPNKRGLFGTGDGSTTFRVPDVRAMFIRSLDDSAGIDPERILGSYQQDAFQGHWHTTATYISGYTNSGSPSEGWNDIFNMITSFTSVNKYWVRNPISDGINDTPRIASETRSVSVAYYCTIKY